MYGYLLALAIGLLILALAIASLGRSRPPAREAKNRPEKPVGPTEPAADEPNPDRSATATPAEADMARRHVPPA